MSAEPGRKAAYSADIGWRVVWQHIGMNLSYKEIGARLQIASSTAHRIFSRFKMSGDVVAKNQPLRPQTRHLDDYHELLIIGIISENPCTYLREIRSIIKEATGVIVSEATVCRVMKRNGFTRKKIQYIAKQRSVQYRADFLAHALLFRKEQFVWIDETGSDKRQSLRKFGYSLKGLPPVCHRFLVRGIRISALAAICSEGLLGVELTTGTFNGDKFFDFLRGTLIPNMNPFDGSSSKSVIVLDNCSIHHVPEVIELLEDAGILVMFLPPYSPDLNPIEETFSSVKYFIKDHDELYQTTDDPQSIIQSAFDNITKEQCVGWISDSGYA